MTFDQLADRTPEESASAAMHLSLAPSAAERAKDPTRNSRTLVTARHWYENISMIHAREG